MKGLFKNKIYIILLLVISFISHWYIFFDYRILNWGDWVYYFNSQSSTVLNFIIYLAPFDLGLIMPLPSNWVFYLTFYFINFLGISWDVFTRLFFLIPMVFLTPLFSFLLFKKIFKSNLIAFFSSCIYSFNTFFLKLQLDHITYAFIWWILPALFLSIINYLETKKSKYLIYNSLLVFVGIVYEIRIMILVLVFLSFFQFIHLIIDNNRLKKKIRDNIYIFISYGIGILMHSFWLIPMLFGLNSDIMAHASSTPFTSFYDILDAFTLHMYSWSHNLVLYPFIKQPIDLRHFLIPILALCGMLFFTERFKNRSLKLYFSFFSLSALIFIFLAKQELVPFSKVYGWLFYNFPLFNIYRESSKFFILAAISLSFFYGIGLYWIYNFIQKYNKRMAILTTAILLFFSSIFNLQHFFDQKIGGMTKGMEIPEDYKILEEKLSNDNQYYRILWLPTKHRFGFHSEIHPFVSMGNLISIFKDKANFTPFDRNLLLQNQLSFLLKQQCLNQLLDRLSVKYVVIPSVKKTEVKKNMAESEWTWEIFRHYGASQEAFVKEISKLPYLEKIDIGTEELAVFENKDFRPHIYITDEEETIYKYVDYQKIDYQFVNPTKYTIRLKNLSEPVYLNFSEAYHPDWKIRVGDFNWFKVLTEKNYFLLDEFHFENDAKLNSFMISPEYIKSHYSDSFYKENSDGSMDLELTLYFRPQSHLYFGLIISITTLAACLGYLIYLKIRDIKILRNIKKYWDIKKY